MYFDIITENEDDEIDNRNWTFSKDDAAELMEIKLEDFKVSFFSFSPSTHHGNVWMRLEILRLSSCLVNGYGKTKPH